jgi:hypothetical protein
MTQEKTWLAVLHNVPCRIYSRDAEEQVITDRPIAAITHRMLFSSVYNIQHEDRVVDELNRTFEVQSVTYPSADHSYKRAELRELVE